jgi:thiamine pyrophosphokinase
MYCVIVANAPECDLEPYQALIAQAELLIAADGGAEALLACGMVPQLVIGDLDSVAQTSQVFLEARGVAMQRHPRDKDETDLELALLYAATQHATEIDVLGALGGRWDHTFANVALLALPALLGRKVRLIDHEQVLTLVRDRIELTGFIGDTISLLPLTAAVHGVTTHGLQYGLEGATLLFEHARGVSNVLIDTAACVTIEQGLLLVIHSHAGGLSHG